MLTSAIPDNVLQQYRTSDAVRSAITATAEPVVCIGTWLLSKCQILLSLRVGGFVVTSLTSLQLALRLIVYPYSLLTCPPPPRGRGVVEGDVVAAWCCQDSAGNRIIHERFRSDCM